MLLPWGLKCLFIELNVEATRIPRVYTIRAYIYIYIYIHTYIYTYVYMYVVAGLAILGEPYPSPQVVCP